MIAGTLTIITLFLIFPLIFPRVEELPWGLDPVLQTFVSSIDVIIATLPFMSTVWNVFIIALTIKIILFTIEITWKFIELIKPN